MSEKMLITADQVNPLEIFVEGKYSGLLDFIKTESEIKNPSVKTEKGRKLIRSTAAKIASSKVFIEKARKELSDKERSKIEKTLSAILESGNFIKDALVYHAAVVREPLTKYEAEEKAKEEIQKQLNQIEVEHGQALAENIEIDRHRKIEAENAKLKQNEIKRQAEEIARKKLEKEQTDKQNAETEKRIKAEQEAERLKQKGIDDAKQADIDKENAVKLAEQKAVDEAKRIENERLQKEKQKRAIENARAADKSHRKKINREALGGLSIVLEKYDNLPDIESICQQIIIAIVKNEVPNVSIKY